jgi:hypothetical protein
MPAKKLEAALKAVNWNENVASFLTDAGLVQAVAQCNYRLALWCGQFEASDEGNPALPFIREMQTAGHSVAALLALGLYKPAAASMRTVLETALYYTYFRSHIVELATLVRDSQFFLYKQDILDYHGLHTPGFKGLQAMLGLVGDLNSWYSRISALVHCQVPGGWSQRQGLAATKHDSAILALVGQEFVTCESVVHRLFLCTAGRELWGTFSHTAKRYLIKGLTGDVKTALALDAS